jgi:AcrR family transcriptional regulator
VDVVATTTPPRRAPRTRALRVDALRNRERIVAAARDLFTEVGRQAPIDEVARRAGIGNATVYRHFPDRTSLIRSVTMSVIEETARFAEEALAEEPDAASALRRFVHRAADGRIGAASASLKQWFDKSAPEFAAARERLQHSVEAIITQGQERGVLRTDIGVGDVMIALSQLTRPLPGTGCPLIDRYAHRHLELLLDGLCTPTPSPLPGTPATFDDLRGAAPVQHHA